MSEVYVAVGIFTYESSTVMGVFSTRQGAEQYLADYKAFDRAEGYHSKYDDYQIDPVTLDARVFAYGALPGNLVWFP